MHRINLPGATRRCVYRPTSSLQIHEDACTSSDEHYFFDVFGYLHWNEFNLYLQIVFSTVNYFVSTDAKKAKHQMSTNEWISYRPGTANNKWYVKHLNSGDIYYAHADDLDDAQVQLRADGATQFGFHPADRSFFYCMFFILYSCLLRFS